MIAPERLYRTADGEICAEDDPRVAFVLVNVGHDVPKEYVAKVKAYLGHDEPAAEPEPEVKEADKPADKQASKAANKSK